MDSKNTWTISKQFDFCYGHRVWAQNLNKELSCNAKNKCRALHGHNGIIEVTIEGKINSKTGMVLDFNELNFLKQFIDTVLDHKCILDINDPIFKSIIPSSIPFIDKVYYHILNTSSVLITAIKEYYDGFTIVDFVPTSENFSYWLTEIVKHTLHKFEGITVKSVAFMETDKSCSTFWCS